MTQDWRDGRLVVRRPEAKQSDVAKCCVPQTAVESEELALTLAASVDRRRGLSRRDRAQQLADLAALEAGTPQ